MSLLHITEHTLYLPGANNLGVIATGDGGAMVVDTGLERDAARKLRRALDERGLRLHTIISTHHHADHIGGNDYLLRNVPDVQVYAPPLEATFIENPILAPTYLNYGASPLRALRTRWLMAKGSRVHHLIGDIRSIIAGESLRLEIAGLELEVIGLSGHSMGQVGIVYDGVCFAADGFFGASIIDKHGMLYAHDIAEQLATFERLSTRQEAWFLPGHGDLTPRSELGAILAANRVATERASQLVLDVLGEPADYATVTARVLRAMGRTAQTNPPPDQLAAASTPIAPTIPQYVVFAGAVVAHLSYLEQQGRVRAELDSRGMVWQRQRD